jgi:hypothetical protein
MLPRRRGDTADDYVIWWLSGKPLAPCERVLMRMRSSRRAGLAADAKDCEGFGARERLMGYGDDRD